MKLGPSSFIMIRTCDIGVVLHLHFQKSRHCIFIDGSITPCLLVWDSHTPSSVAIASFSSYFLFVCLLFCCCQHPPFILVVGGRPELSSFSKEYTEYAGGTNLLEGRGQWPLYAFKNVDYDALHFHTGSVKSTFSKYSFGREGGRGSQKSTMCTLLLIMLTIMDDP